MKRIKLTLSILVSIVIILGMFACAGGPDVTGAPGAPEKAEPEKAEAPATEAPEKAEEEEAEPQPEYREVTERVQLVEKKSFYYPDGVLDRYRVYTYAETGADLLEEKLFNAEDELQERTDYSYEAGKIVSETTYDSDGNTVSTHRYEYDEDGNLVEDRLLGRNEELQSISRYEYGEKGRKVKWSVYDADDSLLAYTEYSYEDGKNTRIENYRPGGTLDDYFVIEYDDRGRRKRETWYTASGDIEEYRTYTYENGALVRETVHRGNDSVKRKIIYTNNEEGNAVKAVYMDGGDNVQERVAYEYVERTRTRRVPVE